MIISGYQLRAARTLIGLEQMELSRRAKVGIATLQRMEACGLDPVRGRLATFERIRAALEALGVEFINGDNPGVRLIKRHMTRPGKARRSR